MKILSSLFLSLLTFFSGSAKQATTFLSQPTSSQQVEQQQGLTQDQLLTMAGDKYADGNLPLGNNRYVTAGPQKGYIYLCHAQADPSGGGAQGMGFWIHGNMWSIKEKLAVQGHVQWPSAQFTQTENGDTRILSGNDLPSHSTGIFPIQLSDPVSAYDRNPNSIKPQSFTDSLPMHPVYSDTPHCIGGEVGIMLTGVALFDGFDAGLRDAAAYEAQDSCNGHPQISGEYHYHSLSSCITNIDETTVIGYALDGFPITGPKVADNKYLTTDSLDECHGITSEIMLDGKMTQTYHYVMTEDFPYSVSCFRGNPVHMQVIQGTGQQGVPGQDMRMQGGSQNSNHPQPPQEAFTVCTGKISGTACQFSAPNGTISGTCQTPPNQTALVCVPANRFPM